MYTKQYSLIALKMKTKQVIQQTALHLDLLQKDRVDFVGEKENNRM
jgi:hypothetical protein